VLKNQVFKRWDRQTGWAHTQRPSDTTQGQFSGHKQWRTGEWEIGTSEFRLTSGSRERRAPGLGWEANEEKPLSTLSPSPGSSPLSLADPGSFLGRCCTLTEWWPEESATVPLPSCSDLPLHPSFTISVSFFSSSSCSLISFQ